jgi:hypothetical protein
MVRLPPSVARVHRRVVGFGVWGLLFGLAYAQSPLYTSNQNQYFLHGAARAGIGDLARDWLANTVDSVPVFSLLVEAVYHSLPAVAFYLIYIVLLGVYVFSLYMIGVEIFDLRRPPARLVFLVGLTLVHSAALRFVVTWLLGVEWDYLFDGGVAGQRLLGPVLQPSSFGVLLLLSIALFLQRRLYLAVGAAVAAATIHPTYLLSAATLTLGYMLVDWREARSLRHPALVGLSALALVAPIGAYVFRHLGPSASGVAREAQRILVEFRIPHHAVVSEWLDLTVFFKLGIIVGGLWVARRSRLAAVLAFCLAMMVGLTLVQVAARSDTLALMFPWRLSVMLVPIGTALLTAWLAIKVLGWIGTAGRKHEPWFPTVSWLLGVTLALAGIVRFTLELGQARTNPARPMMAFVAGSRLPGDVYLIPPRLQEFRLATGTPALVDFKSIPYLDVEVLEWYERVRMADWFYRDRIEYVDCGLLDRFRDEYGVTHIVLDQPLLGLTCPGLGQELYRDESYGVYRMADP